MAGAQQLSEVASEIRRAGLPVLVLDDYSRQVADLQTRPMEVWLSMVGLRVAIRTRGSDDQPAQPTPPSRYFEAGWLRIGFQVLEVQPPDVLWVGVRIGIGRFARIVGRSIGGTGRSPRSTLAVPFVQLCLRSLAGTVLLLDLLRTLLRQLSVTALRSVGSSALAALRAMPVLLAILFFLFATGDGWRLFGRMGNWRLGGSLLALLVAGSTLLRIQLNAEARSIIEPEPSVDLEAAAGDDTAAAALVKAGVTPYRSRLGFWARRNVTSVLAALAMTRMLALGMLVAAGFTALGMLLVTTPLTTDFTGDAMPTILWQPSVAGHELILSLPLVRVALMLGGIAFLYFPTAGIQDGAARAAFVDPMLGGVRRAVAAYRFYRGALQAAAEQVT